MQRIFHRVRLHGTAYKHVITPWFPTVQNSKLETSTVIHLAKYLKTYNTKGTSHEWSLLPLQT